MNDKNVNTHNSVEDSLEAFRPFPVDRSGQTGHKWLACLMKLVQNKH